MMGGREKTYNLLFGKHAPVRPFLRISCSVNLIP